MTLDKRWLDKRCLNCGELLAASTHVSRNERKRRDEVKIYCGGKCAAIYKARNIAPIADRFLYGVR